MAIRTLLLLSETRNGSTHRGSWARAQGPAATRHDPTATWLTTNNTSRKQISMCNQNISIVKDEKEQKYERNIHERKHPNISVHNQNTIRIMQITALKVSQ